MNGQRHEGLGSSYSIAPWRSSGRGGSSDLGKALGLTVRPSAIVVRRILIHDCDKIWRMIDYLIDKWESNASTSKKRMSHHSISLPIRLPCIAFL